MFLLLLTLGDIEQSQQIRLQRLDLQHIVQVRAIDLQFLNLIDNGRILQLLLRIEALHNEQQLILILAVQTLQIDRQLIPPLLLGTQRNILKQIHQEFQSLVFELLTKDYTDLGGILWICIEEGLPQAVIEAILGVGVAMGDMDEVVSDGKDALLTGLPVEKIHAVLGLSHRNGVLYGLPQQNIQFNWSVLQQGSTGVLRVCALHR